MLQAVRRHTDSPWVLLYIERWLKAPVQMEDGSVALAFFSNLVLCGTTLGVDAQAQPPAAAPESVGRRGRLGVRRCCSFCCRRTDASRPRIRGPSGEKSSAAARRRIGMWWVMEPTTWPRLRKATAGANDTVKLVSTSGGGAYSEPSALSLSNAWTETEFNVVGDLSEPSIEFTETNSSPTAVSCSHSIGDTHLETLDGLFYDYQAAGDWCCEAQRRRRYSFARFPSAPSCGRACR
jgi:hypothetical protein